MLIRRNNTLSRRQSHAPPNDLLPLRQKESAMSEEGPLVLVPSVTLNPENPITSVLVSDNPSHPLFRADREQSQFSFKQGCLLAEQDPQQLEARTVAPQQKPTILIRQPPKSTVAIEKVSPEEGRPSKGRKAVGTITNIRQGSAVSRSQSSEQADSGMRRPCSNSLGGSRLEQVLNRIKSLRMGGVGEEGNGGPKMRYSTMRHDESKVESTSTSGEEASPIKKEVISSIRKHVQRMNLSLAKDHRIKQEQSDTEELSFLFKPNEVASKALPQDLLQSKNKSFLVRSTNKKCKREGQTLQISYKTSILQLKELSGRFDESMRVKISVPAAFSIPIFHSADSQQDLFEKAVSVLRELGAACLHPMTIRKYANCVLVMVDQLGLLSYFSGHVYFGGWQQEGKSGMGLEVVPGKFVYYGEFRSNRRQGYGVLKDWQGSNLLGEWHQGKFMDPSQSPLKIRSF